MEDLPGNWERTSPYWMGVKGRLGEFRIIKFLGLEVSQLNQLNAIDESLGDRSCRGLQIGSYDGMSKMGSFQGMSGSFYCQSILIRGL